MDPDDWDYSGIRAAARSCAEWCTWCHCRGTFEISWFIRGMDGFMMDLAADPARACGLMDRVQERQERLRRILEAGGDADDMAEYNDDVGIQSGLMMSPEMWRKYLKPRVAEIFDLIIDPTAKIVRYHSCGGVRDILPDLIDIGLQGL